MHVIIVMDQSDSMSSFFDDAKEAALGFLALTAKAARDSCIPHAASIILWASNARTVVKQQSVQAGSPECRSVGWSLFFSVVFKLIRWAVCSLAKSGEDHDFGPDMQFSGGASDHVAAWKEVQKVLAESDQDFDLQVAVFFTDGGKTQNYIGLGKLTWTRIHAFDSAVFRHFCACFCKSRLWVEPSHATVAAIVPSNRGMGNHFYSVTVI